MVETTNNSYQQFLNQKNYVMESTGFQVSQDELNPKLFQYEKDIVRWALAKGKAAIFSDCGTGKTAIQLAWADEICRRTGGTVLVLAPLAVADQTRREGEKFGITSYVAECQADVVPNAINITNYEKLDKFISSEFIGVVLDESSILKSFTGKVRTAIIDRFAKTDYRLACTATPAPNDYMELGNHAEFLGVMRRKEMLSMFFVHDGGQTSKWRLKGHAESLFWQWMATWAVFLDNPKSLGYDQCGFDLPPLRVHEVIADGDKTESISLSLTERRQARRDSMEARVSKAAELVNNSDEQWLVWCDLNVESEALKNAIEGSVEVKGSDTNTHKSESMLNFSDGIVKCLVTKPSICGFGMNWQNCRKMIFVGLSDSYEKYYQAVRRCWRFGQTEAVDVYIVISAKEGCVKDNIARKETDAERMKNEMLQYTKEITKKELRQTCRMSSSYDAEKQMVLPKWSEFAA